MKAFLELNDVSGIVRGLAVVAVIGIWFNLMGVATVMGTDFSKCDPFSRDECVSMTQSESAPHQVPVKQPSKLKLMGVPRAEKLPTDIRSVPPETVLGVQGITTASSIQTQE